MTSKTCIILFLSAVLFQSTYAQAPLGKVLSKAYSTIDPGKPQVVIVYLKDKETGGKGMPDAGSLVSERSLKRRLKVRSAANVVDQGDLPLSRRYVSAVSANVLSVRNELKWFNAVTAMATKSQIEQLRNLPFVKEVDLVGRWRVDPSKETFKTEKTVSQSELQAPEGTTSLSYGPSWSQLHQINVPAVHDLGIYGQGIVVGVFDNGVRLINSHAFDSVSIIAQHDFVDHKESVVPNNTNTGFGSHGVWTLSTIGGYVPGQLIGPAFKASYILARTENDSSETPMEEDNWAKAIEWADSIGVDVTSTSLGYLGYDAPYTSWTPGDLDGNTTLITKAADYAVQRGIVVVNSAGNDGPGAQTLIAPADGDSVITAGAVDSLGNVAGFSSRGPTADNRIKPDVMAMGVSVYVASSTNVSGYGRVGGTSFSCPLSAGVAALVLCANPSLTPMQVREAMRNTANNSSSPNNTYGWGVLNALAAIQYHPAVIKGTTFYDINGDGVRQPAEPMAPGFTVHLTGTKDTTLLTDGAGGFLVEGLPFGNYSVAVTQDSLLITTSNQTYDVTLASDNSMAAGLTFGFFDRGTISGKVYNDINWTGTDDAGDSVLAGWKVYIAGPKQDSVLTDVLGSYSFQDLGPGTYTITEELPTGWSRTQPQLPSFSVTMTSGLDSGNIAFGNIYLSVHSYEMSALWNLFSLPLMEQSSLKSVLFPTAVTNAFYYDGIQYRTNDTLLNGVGYWLKFDTTQIVSISGAARSLDTVQLHQGWNMIGTISSAVTVAGIVTNPADNIGSPFFAYDHGYIAENTTLQPWRGYWVKAKAPGYMILSGSAAVIRARAAGKTTLH